MKRLLLFFTLILFGTMLGAQSRWAFGLDVEGGVSGEKDIQEAYYPNPPIGEYTTRTALLRRPGMSAGIWTEFLLSHRFGLRLGMNYAKLSAFSEIEGINYNAVGSMTSYSRDRYEQQQHQLRIPLEGKLYFGPPDRRLRAFISVGAQAGRLLSQMTITNNYYGGAGQSEAYEGIYATEVDLSNEYFDIKRWQMSLMTGLGVTGDRFTLSLQRTWGKKREGGYYDYYGGICNCFGPGDYLLPHYGEHRPLQQLHLTSLRFAYRLF